MAIGRTALCDRRCSALCGLRSPQRQAAAGAAAAPPPGAAPRQRPATRRRRTAHRHVPGQRVHLEYRVLGHGEPAVILIHGWACDANYWHGQFDALKARYTVVAVNLAGHGASGSQPYRLVDRQLRRRCRQPSRGSSPSSRIVLVGHSMGATVALAAARRIGPRVIGIIAVDALRSVGMPPLSAPGRSAARIAPFRADFVGATRKLVTRTLFAKGADPLLVQKVAYDMSLSRRRWRCRRLKGPAGAGPPALLPANVHVPVYAINSDLAPTDASASVSRSRTSHSTCSTARRALPHAGSSRALQPAAVKDIGGARGAPPH